MKFTSQIFFTAVLLICVLNVFAQEKAALTDDDQAKLANAELELLNADAKYKEAENIYSEISNSQSTLSADKIEKLNKKAIEKHLEFISISFNALLSKFDIYTIRVELFWIRNPEFVEKMPVTKSLELEAKKGYRVAKELFNEHKEISDNLLQLAKASDAKDSLSKALEIMKIAFERCENPVPEVISIEPASEQEIKPDTLAEIVDTIPVIQQSEEEIQPAQVILDTSPPIVEPDSQVTENKNLVLPDTGALQEESSSLAPEHNNKYLLEGKSFRVQIAASRVPLNEDQLAEIYSGPEVPEERLINEWYKYTIGSFTDFESAVSLMQQCGVEDAFVVNR